MKYSFTILLIGILTSGAKCQQTLPDSLTKAFQQASNDSVKFTVTRAIYTFYEETNRDSALYYAQLRYAIAKKYNRKIEVAYLMGQMAYQQIYLGDFSAALTNLTEALQIATDSKETNTWELTPFNTAGKSREVTLSMLNHMYGHLKLQTGSAESLQYFKEGRRIGVAIGNAFRVTVADMVLATNYLMLNQPDSALIYAQEGEVYGMRGAITKYLANVYLVMGDIYFRKGLDTIAFHYYQQSLQIAIPQSNLTVVSSVYESLTNYYLDKGNADSSIYYAARNAGVVKLLGAVNTFSSKDISLGKIYQHLARAYALKGNKDSSNKYLQIALAVKDSFTVIKASRIAAFQRLTLDEQIRLQEKEKGRIAADNNRKMYLLFAGIILAFSIILLVYRNNRQQRKAYTLLEQQKAATDLEKQKADAALHELKATQSQLIQSEKMASLGELTAGIAHEIQNPLNFVNNFSEVSGELMDEMNEELSKGDIDEAKVIAADIKQNLEKINHHGKRADAIVKGMLQHSGSGGGKKEPTNINKLADEYLRLAFHGLRAKDKSLNATLKTDYDESIGLINIVPQDIGRVILNLLTNAFYAVNEKALSAVSTPAAVDYSPTVSITTKRSNDQVEITIADNGNGIPQPIIDKIFQPFFTTKPTGKGTGLGLSLAYDIVKAHGGELNVESNEGRGTTFSICLSILKG